MLNYCSNVKAELTCYTRN